MKVNELGGGVTILLKYKFPLKAKIRCVLPKTSFKSSDILPINDKNKGSFGEIFR